MPRILLTGATGYIGSHTWLALREAGFDVVGVDNFANSSPRVLERLAGLLPNAPAFEQADVCDEAALAGVFARHAIDAVVHFAAHKAVGESISMPLEYYRNNIGGLISVARMMQAHSVHALVYSSSATVYGDPQKLPIGEDAPIAATSPYGTTKLVGEQLLRELGRCEPRWRIATLRYFNPVGAHPSGRIGEHPSGVPNNLMPYVSQVAVGQLEYLRVFGDDYDTPDGTGVRDYIHVVDLAEGHVAALRHLLAGGASHTVNLGTGRGSSVLEVVRAFEAASGREIPYRVQPRRAGDVAACYADASLAHRLLGWHAKHDLHDMCAHAWAWQRDNPRGFAV
ncbi:MAG: UDP-glucose 4-epimerase GalE [Burkholderiaceae bacterium]|nr:MAG: UDP-glucose 4-epimerase GalE [Burkholderiaceae bacterium]MCC7286455.1 UDP-glucose 4-epimerase GalE [Burkholderiaceae bacterium]